MKIIAFMAQGDAVTEGAVTREILGHLGEPTSPPRLMPARGPLLWEMQGSGSDAILRKVESKFLSFGIGGDLKADYAAPRQRLTRASDGESSAAGT